MSDKEYLAKRFEESFRLGKEVGEMLATPPAGNIDMEGARAAVNQAEENMRQAVATFQAREKELKFWTIQGWYQCVYHLEDDKAMDFLKMLHVPQDIISGVMREIKDFRDKAISRSEKP